jgi:hypothetical protein
LTENETPRDPYYIPPTAGPGAGQKKPEKRPDEDWRGLAIIVIGLILLVAVFQLFMILMQLINTWIADPLVPVFSGAFDIVLIVAGIWLIQKYLRKP